MRAISDWEFGVRMQIAPPLRSPTAGYLELQQGGINRRAKRLGISDPNVITFVGLPIRFPLRSHSSLPRAASLSAARSGSNRNRPVLQP